MTVFTEDFNAANADYLEGQTADLGVNSWYIQDDGTGIFTNSLSKAAMAVSNPVYAEANLEVGTGNQSATITTAAVSVGAGTNEVGSFGITLGLDDPTLYNESWFLFVRGDFNDGLWRYQVTGQCSNGGGGVINDFTTSFLTGSTLSVGDTLTLAITGTGLDTVVVVKQNGVTLATYTSVDMLAAGFVSADFNFLPTGSWMGLTVGNAAFVINSNRIDAMSATVTPSGPVDHKLPALSSDVPYLQANDRYQVVACVNRGDSTHAPEFRYWYAGAPSWDESV